MALRESGSAEYGTLSLLAFTPTSKVGTIVILKLQKHRELKKLANSHS